MIRITPHVKINHVTLASNSTNKSGTFNKIITHPAGNEGIPFVVTFLISPPPPRKTTQLTNIAARLSKHSSKAVKCHVCHLSIFWAD